LILFGKTQTVTPFLSKGMPSAVYKINKIHHAQDEEMKFNKQEFQ
jgi:hypothetical protein